MSAKKENPKKGDDDWQDFIFKQFKETELADGNPTCDGLRRVCEKVYAKIISCVTDIKRVPTSESRAATAVCIIDCQEYDTGLTIIQSASADVYEENTQHPYNLHPVATAETRAEGRALRKLLLLDCNTHEELSSNDDGESGRILETQARSIRNFCSLLDIDINKFLTEAAAVDSSALEKGKSALPQKIVKQLLDKLTKYHEKKEDIPDNIKTKSA